jgi:hypothetical protein
LRASRRARLPRGAQVKAARGRGRSGGLRALCKSAARGGGVACAQMLAATMFTQCEPAPARWRFAPLVLVVLCVPRAARDRFWRQCAARALRHRRLLSPCVLKGNRAADSF